MKTNPNEHAFVQNGNNKGLTKREHMAIEFTKAMIVNSNIHEHEGVIKKALVWTDELIKQLNAE